MTKQTYDLHRYRKLQDDLIILSDEKYKKFNDSLITGINTPSYGVRLPDLRKIAKRISTTDWKGFINYAQNSNVYEIKLIQGLLIGFIECNFEEKLNYIRNFVPEIDNWAICDIFCGGLKFFSKNLESVYDFLRIYLHSQKEFELRFAIVILIDYFINDNYIDKCLFHFESIKSDKYYVKMVVAWAISVCFVKYRSKTLNFLNNCKLDDDIYRKSIQKIIESRRVSNKDKILLKSLKKDYIK